MSKSLAQPCSKAANISYTSLQRSFLLLFHRTLVLQSSKEQLFLHKCFPGEFLMAVFWVCSHVNHWGIPRANCRQKRAAFQTKWLTRFSRLYRKPGEGLPILGVCVVWHQSRVKKLRKRRSTILIFLMLSQSLYKPILKWLVAYWPHKSQSKATVNTQLLWQKNTKWHEISQEVQFLSSRKQYKLC